MTHNWENYIKMSKSIRLLDKYIYTISSMIVKDRTPERIMELDERRRNYHKEIEETLELPIGHFKEDFGRLSEITPYNLGDAWWNWEKRRPIIRDLARKILKPAKPEWWIDDFEKEFTDEDYVSFLRYYKTLFKEDALEKYFKSIDTVIEYIIAKKYESTKDTNPFRDNTDEYTWAHFRLNHDRNKYFKHSSSLGVESQAPLYVLMFMQEGHERRVKNETLQTTHL